MFEENAYFCVILVLLAVFGACVKWLNASEQDHVSYKMLWRDLVTAAFCGVLAYSLYCGFAFNQGITAFGSGLSGYCGPMLIEVAIKAFIDHFKLNKYFEESKGT
ncbi:MAG: phage holin family protein [Planctomycetaceae bacterium]|nr:phage holin family protein [Planctomycetaceae bacterium]